MILHIHIQSTLAHGLAAVVIVCGAILLLTDALSACNVRWALRFTWSLPWSIMRYAAIVCAVLLALDVWF